MSAKRPRTVLGWLLGSDEAAHDMLRRLGLEPFLDRCARLILRLINKISPPRA